MSKIVILEKQLLNLYQERSFIDWMIGNLNGQQMSELLVSCGIQMNLSTSKNLHLEFLRNKLLIKPTRTKLVEKRIIPPFDYLLDIKKEGKIWTKEEILEAAKLHDIEDKDLALSLFLQNYHEEAMQLYEKQKMKEVEKQWSTEETAVDSSTEDLAEETELSRRDKQWIKEDEDFNTVLKKLEEMIELKEQKKIGRASVEPIVEETEPQESDEQPTGEDKNLNKILKKLEQRVEILIIEKSTLLEEARNMKIETRETNRQQQKEIESLKQELAEKNKIISNHKMDTSALKIALESSLSSNELLKLKMNKPLPSEPKKIETDIEKKRVALLGNPKNNSVVTRTYLNVDVFTPDTIQDYLNFQEDYDYVFYLSYTLDRVVFEKFVPQEDRQKIVQLENFLSLKKKMEELDHE